MCMAYFCSKKILVPGILQARTLEWAAISFSNICMHAKLLQSCPTLCDPMDSSPPGSYVHRILQARILEWVAISFSRYEVWPPENFKLQNEALTGYWDLKSKSTQDNLKFFTETWLSGTNLGSKDTNMNKNVASVFKEQMIWRKSRYISN